MYITNVIGSTNPEKKNSRQVWTTIWEFFLVVKSYITIIVKNAQRFLYKETVWYIYDMHRNNRTIYWKYFDNIYHQRFNVHTGETSTVKMNQVVMTQASVINHIKTIKN